MFIRHSNPWSAWSRWATTPSALMPVWTRRRDQAALIAAWFAVNPLLFGRRALLTGPLANSR
jgi:hypothetical protein